MSRSAYYMKFDELRRVIGHPAAIRLVFACGGERIYVREQLPDDHCIVAAIGSELGRVFSTHIAMGIGGLAVEIPRAGSSAQDAYRRRLRELASDPALSSHDIAGRLNIHSRTVRRMRAHLRGYAGQVSGARTT